MTYLKFKIAKEINQDHKDFFNKNGFLHFKNFLIGDEIERCQNEINAVELKWMREGANSIFGIPIFWGKNYNGDKIAHRIPFTSVFSSYISSLLESEEIQSLKKLLPGEWRIGDKEKDGVVSLQYFYNGRSKRKEIGWHTDSVRDIFYFRKIQPMLNVGIHLTSSNKNIGNLKVLPGTHKQNVVSMLTRKMYYINTRKDRNEISIEPEAGDLTVHHGNIWHRVDSPINPVKNMTRVVMYFPIICGKKQIKDHNSSTPLYHKFQMIYK